tara:strand:- start:33 stop:305 length:273 start_codon:yes stop_codon:yes gene_type:complete
LVYQTLKISIKIGEKNIKIADLRKTTMILDSTQKLTYPESRRPGIPLWIALSHYLPSLKLAPTAPTLVVGGVVPTNRDAFSVNCVPGPVT